MSILVKNKAAKDYRRRFLIAMACYVAALSFTVHYVERYRPVGVLAFAIALLPALPILGVIVIAGMYIAEERDEYQRMVQMQTMLWAMGLTMATLTVWGFLEMFAGAIHFQPYLAFPLFWGFVGVASPFVQRRYR